MYFFGLSGVGLLVWVLETTQIDQWHKFGIFFGALFVNIAGWLHGHNQAKERAEKTGGPPKL
jgi:hypothetical protein